jgi:two-component system, response regulator RegA
MNEEAGRVLVVEDDEVFRTRLVYGLGKQGFEVVEANSVASAEQHFERFASGAEDWPEYALLDLRLADGFGLALVKKILAGDPGTRIVILTGYGSIANAVEAVQLGAVQYLTKPVSIELIVKALLGSQLGTQSPSATADTPSLARVEWEHIQRVMADCEGNITHAAKVLGLHRRSLQRKLSKMPSQR